jgi:hypothetical protein
MARALYLDSKLPLFELTQHLYAYLMTPDGKRHVTDRIGINFSAAFYEGRIAGESA